MGLMMKGTKILSKEGMVKIKNVRDRLERWHRGRCPFCNQRMAAGKSGIADPWTRSQMHLHSTGSPRDSRDLWVYGCHGCNQSQGALSLDEWLLILEHREDPRTELVRAAVNLMIDEGVLP